MADPEPLPIPRQTFEVVPETNVSPDLTLPEVSAREDVLSSWRTTGGAQFIRRHMLLPVGHPADPNFNPWAHMVGHEGDEADLASTRSQSEFDATVQYLERNRQDHYNAANGPIGIVGDLIIGLADPVNLIPIPVVKGIGMMRGALAMGAAVGGISAGEEYLRQKSDPLARPEEAFFNIGLGTVLGGMIGAPIGAWGAGAGRRARAIRAMEEALSDPDNPNFSLRPRADDGMSYKYQRPPRNIDGSYSRFKVVDEAIGWQPKVVDGVRYVSEDGATWVRAADVGRAEPLSVSDDIAEQLGMPEPVMGKTMYVDELSTKAEHQRAQWQDELQAHTDAPIERVVLDGNDFTNFRIFEHRMQLALPRLIDETAEAWHARVGKAAMQEFQASKMGVGYAGPEGIAWVLERLNFSPVAKLIRTFKDDNYVADLALRMGGDYGWAIKANAFGWSTPPSVLLKQIRHTARYHQWLAVFDEQFLKYASGNKDARGRLFQGLNVGAAAYNRINGVRRMGGAKVITKDIFEEMVAEAVFRKGDFEVQGFPVNENVRAASKAFTEMAQEYDELHRAVGNFRDQKTLTRDIKHWRQQEIKYKNAVMKWLWGKTGQPASLLHAIRVNDRIFTGASHDEAIQNMMDALGDDGIALSENLTANNYGYTYREGVERPPVVETPPDPRRVLPPGRYVADPAYANFTTTGEALDHLIALNQDSDLTGLARMIRGEVADIPFRSINAADVSQLDARDAIRLGGMGRFDPNTNDIFVTGEGFQYGSGANTEVVLHEAFHGAAHNRIEMGKADIKAGVDSPHARAVKELQALHSRIFDETDFGNLDLSLAEQALLRRQHDLATRDIHELVSYGLTSPAFRRYLESIPYDGDTSLWQQMWEVLGRLFGIEPKSGQLGKLMQINDQLMKTAKPEYGVASGELFIPEPKAMEGQHDIQALLDKDMNGDILTSEEQALVDDYIEKSDRLPERTFHLLSDVGPHGNDLTPAVRYKGEVIADPNHTEAIAQMIDRHPEFEALFEANPELYLGWADEQRFGPQPKVHAGGPAAAEAEPAFVTVDEAMDQRVRRLTPAQRAIYDKRASSLTMAQENLARSEADLKVVTEMPHQFLDANGNPEPWYHRIWDKAKGATEREQLTRLITRWYERDNPDGARQRAELTVDNILNEDAEIGDKAGMSALSQRKLNIPNSWTISDPQFGELKISDFIDRRIRSVADHYIHRSAAKIETARMFGDSEMRAEKVRLREYLMQRYYEPATSDGERAAAMARIEEAEGWMDIIQKSVAGTLRTTDPWRLDNRIARGLKNVTTLGIMGMVQVASLGEIFRPGMVNGYGTYFRTLFTKYLDDLEAMRGNIEFGGLTAELNDLSMNRMHVQQATIQNGEPALGGTSFERWLNDKAGGFYNIAGLTSLTTWQKVMSGLAAQHSVMADARTVGLAMLEGRAVDQQAAFRLRAMGISDRDAVLLAGMPIETYQGGKLILPAVDNWKALGADGRRAREVLLNGIHAEMRRSIVTPSIGDRSTVFNGVWTYKGRKIFESDLMTLPMQFLSYGMGAHNKLLTSSIQGRDRSTATGLFYMMLSGIFATWVLSDEDQWRRKTYDQILADGFDRSGIGGFWFNGINGQIERVTNNRMSYRKLLGIDPDFKHDPKKDADAMAAIAGAAPKYFYDVSRAFWDTSITGSQRAQLIRKGIPYNNVYWWEKAFDTMQNEGVDMFGGKGR